MKKVGHVLVDKRLYRIFRWMCRAFWWIFIVSTNHLVYEYIFAFQSPRCSSWPLSLGLTMWTILIGHFL